MTTSLLKGKKGIISGALDESSIAWKVAKKAHEQGAQVLLTNAPVALRLGPIAELAKTIDSEVIPADATSVEDLNKLYDAASARFGKIDFILHSIGMSPNVRKDKPYTNVNYEWLNKTYDVSAISFHKMMSVAYNRDLMNEWGSIVALSFIAAQRTFPKYNDMNDAKALLESIARTFGYYFAKKNKVRVNTISQSPTVTTAGSGITGFNEMLQFAEKMAPLGNATADECADLCVTLFSDLTRKVTMQNLYNDGGFSSVGATPEVLEFAKG
jgi:enoyl-[acyl-carrier protein] reductase I